MCRNYCNYALSDFCYRKAIPVKHVRGEKALTKGEKHLKKIILCFSRFCTLKTGQMGKLKKEAVDCYLFYIFTFFSHGFADQTLCDFCIEESKHIISLIPIREHPKETQEGHQGLHQKSQVPSVLLNKLAGFESQEAEILFRTLETMKDFLKSFFCLFVLFFFQTPFCHVCLQWGDGSNCI